MPILISSRESKNHCRGYSLIEIIFVIAVTGILAGISVPSLINWKYFQNIKTRQLALKTNLEQIKSDAKRWGATCTLNGRTMKSSCASAVLQKSITDSFNMQSTQEVVIEPIIKDQSDKDIFTATNFNKITFTPRGFIHVDPIQSGGSIAIFVIGYKNNSDPFKAHTTEMCVTVDNLTGRVSAKRRNTKQLGSIKTSDAIYAASQISC